MAVSSLRRAESLKPSPPYVRPTSFMSHAYTGALRSKQGTTG